MLFVLAARREAPIGLMTVSKSGVPRAAILTSSIVGFLCVIAAAVSPDTVFLFLLNSSGAVILFVYLLIAISQVVLRRRTTPDKLVVKMWLFPVLSIIVIVAIVAVLVQMGLNSEVRTQLMLSLLAWAVVVIIFFATKRIREKVPAEPAAAGPPTGDAHRVLVLANETVEGDELIDELRKIDRAGRRGVLHLRAGQPDRHRSGHACGGASTCGTRPPKRLRRGWTVRWTCCVRRTSRSRGARRYRPLRALANAVAEFSPDRLVICTHPEDRSTWLRYDVVERARETYPNLPITHVIVETAPVAV